MSARPDTDEDGLCPACNGSGEGQFEGSRCATCGGSGDDLHPWGRPRNGDAPDEPSERTLVNKAVDLLMALSIAALLGTSHYLDGADSPALQPTASAIESFSH
jgi:hypothetical protein